MAMTTRTDEDIKKDVVDQLCWDDRIDASGVKVNVSDGLVTLAGKVLTTMVAQAAQEDAWSIQGVQRVINDVSVKHDLAGVIPTDAEIGEKIQDILRWQPIFDPADIEVTVEDGWATLRGTVDAIWKKTKAEQLAVAIKGVLGLTNELAVVPTDNPDDKIIAEAIAAALERSGEVDVDLIEIIVEKGDVTLRGSVPSPQAYRTAQQAAENTLGVLTLDNELIIR